MHPVRGEDYNVLYRDLDVRRMLGEETDPLEGSQDELLGVITVAPTRDGRSGAGSR